MNRKFLLSAVFIMVAFFSCQKNEQLENVLTPSNLNLVVDDATTTEFINQMMILVDYYSGIDEAIIMKSATIDGGCATITRVTKQGSAFPVTITIDFGTSCVDKDGKTKSGKVTITKSASWITPGATRTVTFDNHFVDGVKMEGSQSSKNDGVINGKQTFTWSGNITLTKADKTSVTRSETRTRAFIAGFSTPAVTTDDVIEITGSSKVTKSDNTTYSRSIIVPLVRKGDCGFITAGKVEIKNAKETFTIDYGTGACDNKATVTRGTTTKEITLK